MSDRYPKSLVGLRYFNFDTYYVGEFKLRTTQQELFRLTDVINEEESPYDVITYSPCGKLIAITLRGGVTLYIKRKKANMIIADNALLRGCNAKGPAYGGNNKTHFDSFESFMLSPDPFFQQVKWDDF
jgi:hypothetical protein